MQYGVKQFIKDVRSTFPWKFRNKRVLEVGSHNINGSPRKYFWFCNYTGIDISKGKGVDKVVNVLDYYPKYGYDVVICTEMLEHDKNWDLSLMKMYSLLVDGGLLLITCAGPDCKEHGTKRTSPECSPDTTDYYMNMTTDLIKMYLKDDMFKEYHVQYGRGMNDVYFYGIKKAGAVK